MFDPGTKVIVLASTQKSGAGPRKGSMGHVISSSPSVLVDQNMLATSSVVGFHRFGFEQKTRLEVRTAINLLQLVNGLEEDNVVKHVNSFHNFFNSSKIEDIIPKVADYTQLETGVSLVIMTPYGEVDDDLLTCKDSEFEIWSKAMSFVISPTLYSICFNTPIHISKLQLSGLQSLNSTLSDRSRRDNYIKLLLSNPPARKVFVQTMKRLLAIQNNDLHTSRCRSFSDVINNDIYNTYSNNRFTQDTVRMMYRLLCDNMYNISFSRATQMLVDRPGKECSRNIAIMKKELKSMSKKLLSENTSN